MKRSGEGPPVAVATGAGRGIGKATAIAMAQAGWRVALVSRNKGELESVGETIGGRGGEATCHVGMFPILERSVRHGPGFVKNGGPRTVW